MCWLTTVSAMAHPTMPWRSSAPCLQGMAIMGRKLDLKRLRVQGPERETRHETSSFRVFVCFCITYWMRMAGAPCRTAEEWVAKCGGSIADKSAPGENAGSKLGCR